MKLEQNKFKEVVFQELIDRVGGLDFNGEYAGEAFSMLNLEIDIQYPVYEDLYESIKNDAISFIVDELEQLID